MISSHDFQQIARQKLTTAEFLLENHYTLDAMYLGGHTVECTLKALIMEMTPEAVRVERFYEIAQGTKWHNPEVLRGLLNDKLSIRMPLELTRRIRRFQWSVSLRYQLGRWDTGETRGILEDGQSHLRLGGGTITMSQATEPRWYAMRTEETKQVEEILRPFFPNSDSYRFNSASIRVRVIDPRFEGKSSEERDAMVEPLLSKLPESTQADIMSLLTVTPEEVTHSPRKQFANLEFEDPSRSML